MTQTHTILTIGALLVAVAAGYFFFSGNTLKEPITQDSDPTPLNVTLSGTNVCLPHMDTTGPQTMECAFGFKTDDNVYYAVNFGASATGMEQFQSGARITAEGFVVKKEALSDDQWAKYNMEGMFTITRVLSSDPVSDPAAQGKLNIDVVCESALAYTTFPDGASADSFVADCKEGKHPEVIERYKADMNLGDGATI